jgi:lipopolysaccharide transport system permease protein
MTRPGATRAVGADGEAAVLAPFLQLYRCRSLLLKTLATEARQKFAGSVIGRAWLLLGPALLMGLYACIYLFIFRIRPLEMAPLDYVLYIFAGLVPFLGFAEALSSGATSLSRDKSILLNTVFPAELVPLRAVLASHLPTAAGLAIICGLSLALGHRSAAILLVPGVLLLQLMLAAGLCWILALANLVLRDIQQLLTYINLVLLIVSPIAYTPDMVPPALEFLIYLNPFAYVVICYQHPLAFGEPPPLHMLALLAGVAAGSCALGYAFFRKVKVVFFDYA